MNEKSRRGRNDKLVVEAEDAAVENLNVNALRKRISVDTARTDAAPLAQWQAGQDRRRGLEAQSNVVTVHFGVNRRNTCAQSLL